MNIAPSLRDLQQYFTPQYAVQWRVIGTQLGLPTATLDIIEHDHMHKATRCCNAMLRKWLEMDTAASWRKLFTVIESPAVCCSAPDKGDYLCMYAHALCMHSSVNERLCIMLSLLTSY